MVARVPPRTERLGRQTGAMWFETLTGFAEQAVDDVAAKFELDGSRLTSTVNGRTMEAGHFETLALSELRRRIGNGRTAGGCPTVREVVADAQQLHLDPSNAGSLFQVASQFNTLEMVSPAVTPEQGIDRYETDRTQGPACAVACGAGTIVRNYLVDVNGDGHRGQTAERQIDCLAPLARSLGVTVEMRNGYALPTAEQLEAAAAVIHSHRSTSDETGRDDLIGRLEVGVQWDTEVTLAEGGHVVTQAYCSALPVAYASHPTDRWEPFARLVLDGAYEATLAVAALNSARTGNNRAYLTMLGGGVFGNRPEWIIDAIKRAVERFSDHNLDIAVVSHRDPNPLLAPLIGG